MTIGSTMTNWQRPGAVFAVMGWLFFPSWTSAAPVSQALSSEVPAAEHRIAAYHASPALPTTRSSIRGAKQSPIQPIRAHVAEARRVLLELRAFVEKATQTMELGDLLRQQRRENDKLRQSLSKSETAMSAIAQHALPMDLAQSALTSRIVRNWLETVRLKYRSDDVDRDLLASERSRLALESRVATLKRALIERRTALLELRAQRAAMSLQLGQARRQVVTIRKDTQRIERQQVEISTTMTALRRQVTSTLRAVLLKSGAR